MILWFSSTSTPKSFSSGLLSIHSLLSLYLWLGLPRPRCRTLYLALLNLIRFARAHLSSLFSFLWVVSLPSSVLTPSVFWPHRWAWCLQQTCWGFSPAVDVTDKDVKQHQNQQQPLRYATCHWSLLGHGAIHCNSLSAIIQPIPYPLNGPSIKSMPLLFRDKDVVQDSVKCSCTTLFLWALALLIWHAYTIILAFTGDCS